MGSGYLVVKVIFGDIFIMRFSFVYILGYCSGFIINWYYFLVGFGGRSDLG